MAKRGGLGRGLDALIPDRKSDKQQKTIEESVELKENLDTYVYKTIIPRNVRLAESPSYGLPIIRYDTHSAGAQKYRELAKELVKRA